MNCHCRNGHSYIAMIRTRIEGIKHCVATSKVVKPSLIPISHYLSHQSKRGYVTQFVKDRVVQSAIDHISQSPDISNQKQVLFDKPVVTIVDPLTADDLFIPNVSGMQSLDLTSFSDQIHQIDPFEAARPDVSRLSQNIKTILGVDHPVLSTVTKYFFEYDGGKKFRPTMVTLMAHALNAHADTYIDSQSSATHKELSLEEILAAQRRLAEITEMIHTASLLHDDVIDMADTRRGVSSVNTVFGNKLAILAGDFLLARASVCLARLRNIPVIELMSTVIEHLVKGEVLQMKNALRSNNAAQDAFDVYLRKTYYKTGSLMANSCRSVALLGLYSEDVADVAYRYGKHIGLAFQLVDDMLDFTSTSEMLGKPALNDVKQGLATAPVLFASKTYPSLLQIIERKFEAPDDIQSAAEFVRQADGVGQTRNLAYAHAQLALDALAELRPSASRTALAALVLRVLDRSH